MASTIDKEISGDLSIDQIESAIAAFEIGFAAYKSNVISAVGGKKINTVTFEKLILKKPNKFKLTLKSIQTPSGFAKIRDDVMFTDGQTQNVTAWRKNTAM